MKLESSSFVIRVTPVKNPVLIAEKIKAFHELALMEATFMKDFLLKNFPNEAAGIKLFEEQEQTLMKLIADLDKFYEPL